MPIPNYPFILNENAAQNIPAGSGFQAGVSNSDSRTFVPEAKISLPWISNPSATYLGYLNWIEMMLDPGIAVHKVLPQSAMAIDTLAALAIDDPKLPTSVAGVNLISSGGWQDFAQRMSTSTYTFILKGWGARIGYTIPVPGLKTVGGVPAIPGKEWSLGNVIVANYMGVPLYYNKWELHYTVTLPPKSQQNVPSNLGQHIGPLSKAPTALAVPASQPDSNAKNSGPTSAAQNKNPPRFLK